jgi:hypothetical protein
MVSRIVRETWNFSVMEALRRARRDIQIVLRFADEYLDSVALRSALSHPFVGESVEFNMECNSGEGYAGLCMDLALDIASKLLQEREGVVVRRTVEILES